MSQRPYLPCREIIAFLADYLDGTLDAGARAEFDRHLAVCPSCVAYLASYQVTVAMTKASAQDVADPPEELVTAILESTSNRG